MALSYSWPSSWRINWQAAAGIVAAAHDMGMAEVPAIILSHLTDAQKRAYRIADNKLTELGKWSIELLNLEFSELSNLDLDFNLEITGFETAEIDLILDGDGSTDPKADAVPALADEDRTLASQRGQPGDQV